MIASDDSARHEEAWRSLPWLANGRLSQAERDNIEPHVRACAACREELARRAEAGVDQHEWDAVPC